MYSNYKNMSCWQSKLGGNKIHKVLHQTLQFYQHKFRDRFNVSTIQRQSPNNVSSAVHIISQNLFTSDCIKEKMGIYPAPQGLQNRHQYLKDCKSKTFGLATCRSTKVLQGLSARGLHGSCKILAPRNKQIKTIKKIHGLKHRNWCSEKPQHQHIRRTRIIPWLSGN